MRAWATKAMTSATGLADLFLNAENLQKFVHGAIFRHHSPLFDKDNIRAGLGGCGDHGVIIPLLSQPHYWKTTTNRLFRQILLYFLSKSVIIKVSFYL